jgi:hypothetical protein
MFRKLLDLFRHYRLRFKAHDDTTTWNVGLIPLSQLDSTDSASGDLVQFNGTAFASTAPPTVGFFTNNRPADVEGHPSVNLGLEDNFPTVQLNTNGDSGNTLLVDTNSTFLIIPTGSVQVQTRLEMLGNDIYLNQRGDDGSAAFIHNLADPIYPHGAANKNYVDNQISSAPFLPTGGGQMGGTLDMENNSIINVPGPSAGGDAANKTYVDSAIGSVVDTLGAAAQENLGADVIDDGSGNLTLSTFSSVAGTYTAIASITINAEGRITAITAT